MLLLLLLVEILSIIIRACRPHPSSLPFLSTNLQHPATFSSALIAMASCSVPLPSLTLLYPLLHGLHPSSSLRHATPSSAPASAHPPRVHSTFASEASTDQGLDFITDQNIRTLPLRPQWGIPRCLKHTQLTSVITNEDEGRGYACNASFALLWAVLAFHYRTRLLTLAFSVPDISQHELWLRVSFSAKTLACIRHVPVNHVIVLFFNSVGARYATLPYCAGFVNSNVPKETRYTLCQGSFLVSRLQAPPCFNQSYTCPPTT